MKVNRCVSPLLVGLVLAGLIGLPLASMPLTAAPENADAPPTAETPEAAAAKPQRPGRWERLREKITVKDSEYAGTETCAQSRCHSVTVQTWSQLRHTQHVLQAKEWSEDERSCEGCHGPASAHLIDRQHGSIARLSEHPDYVAALCNRCHHGNIEETHFLAGIHASQNLSCGTCHDVHRDHGSIHLLRGPGVILMWPGHGGRKKARPAVPAPEQPEETPAPTTPEQPGRSSRAEHRSN
jgi:hypothetical protein